MENVKIIHKNYHQSNIDKIIKQAKEYYNEGVNKNKSGIVLQNIKG